MHFAFTKRVFPSGCGGTGTGEGSGACARTTVSAIAIAITESPSRFPVLAERPFGRVPDGRPDVGWRYRFGFSGEGEDERHDIRLARALDRRLRTSAFYAPRLLGVAR